MESFLIVGWGGGGGSVREVGKGSLGSRICRVAGRMRKEKSYTTLHNILQSKRGKMEEPTNMGHEPGLKGMGSRKFGPPDPPA